MATSTRRIKSQTEQAGITSGAACRSQRFTTTGTFPFGKPGSVVTRIIIGTTAAGAIRIRDGSEVKVALKSSIAEGSFPLMFTVNNQPYIDLDAASDVTVVWAP